MKSILEMVAGVMSDLACSTMKTESRSVVGRVDLRVSGSNERLSVTVCESFGTLTCKSRGDVGVNGHLVEGGTSHGRERGDWQGRYQLLRP